MAVPFWQPVCSLVSTLTAHAEEQQGKEGWKAEFTGKAIESNFSSQSLADEISGLQPGDSVEIKVAVMNSSGRNTDWYMSNEVLQSLEDSSPANGGAYQYVLTYHGSGDPTVLYSSDQVGGEQVTAAGKACMRRRIIWNVSFIWISWPKEKKARSLCGFL